MAGFTIDTERRGPMLRIRAVGALGARASFRLHDEFYRALATDARTIVIDLRNVTAISRETISSLAFMQRRAGRRLRIIPSDTVARAVRGLARGAAQKDGEQEEVSSAR